MNPTVVRARTFKSGNSEAVRLPKGMGFGVGSEIIVERRGDHVVLRPARNPIEERRKLMELVAAMDVIGPVGEIQKREPIEFPGRPGL